MARHHMHQFIKFDHNTNSHKDIQPSRIRKDLNDVETLISLLKETFVNPMEERQLIALSSGILPTEEVSKDLNKAYDHGKNALDVFIKDRLVDLSVSIYEPIKKLRLGTFSTMKKTKSVKVKGKEVQFSTQSGIFGKVALISQSRTVDMREIFEYPLGLVPYALSDDMGMMVKTNKADLLAELKKGTVLVDCIPSNSCSIIDGMALVRKIRCTGLTFSQVADVLFKAAISSSKRSTRIDIVFDVYFEESIKGVERNRRCSNQLSFKTIIGNNVVRQWQSFLGGGNNKNELVKFLVKEWAEKEIPENLIIFATCGECCICINDKTEIVGLKNKQEEADTRMLLYAVHASAHG